MSTSLIKAKTKFRMFSADLPLLYLANRDRRTPTSTRLITGLAIVYLFSPVDIVPDVLPLMGWVDDLFVTPFLISLALRTVPLDVLADAKMRIRRMKGILLAIVLVFVAAVLIYFGYQYFGHYLPHKSDF